MEDLSKGIKRLTHELRALQPQLEWNNLQASKPGDRNQTLDALLDAGLGEDLKRAVDLLRHFLWCYIESAVVDSDPHVDYALQSKRLEQVTDILRQMNHPACCHWPRRRRGCHPGALWRQLPALVLPVGWGSPSHSLPLRSGGVPVRHPVAGLLDFAGGSHRQHEARRHPVRLPVDRGVVSGR